MEDSTQSKLCNPLERPESPNDPDGFQNFTLSSIKTEILEDEQISTEYPSEDLRGAASCAEFDAFTPKQEPDSSCDESPKYDDSTSPETGNVSLHSALCDSTSLIIIKDKVIPGNGSIPNRAEQTIPDELTIKKISLMEKTVWTTASIPKGVSFGPYEGDIVITESNKLDMQLSCCCLKVYQNNIFTHYLDASDQSRTNWMRFVAVALEDRPPNLEGILQEGKVYFRSLIDIQRDSQLVVGFHTRNFVVNGTSSIRFVESKKEDSSEEDYAYDDDNISRDFLKAEESIEGIAGPSHHNSSPQSKTKKDRDTPKKPRFFCRGMTFPCTICDKVFKFPSHLQRHINRHSTAKTHKCPICDKCFTIAYNLSDHVKRHTADRPHECPECGKRFMYSRQVERHMQVHTKIRPYTCTICEKGLCTPTALKTHLLSHAAIKNHKCHMCDKSFVTAGSLKLHIRVHTGEKPHTCSTCGQSFRQSSTLKTHQKRHIEKL